MSKVALIAKRTRVLYFFLIFIGCSAQKVSKETESALHLISTLPIPDSQNGLLNLKREVTLVERDSISIFKCPVWHHFSRTNINKDGDHVNDQFLKTDTSYYYVFYKQGEKVGYKYDSLNNVKWTTIGVDSFLASSTILSLDGFVAKKLQDSLISTFFDKDEAMLVEKYIPRNKPDQTYSDTTIMIYKDEFDGFRFSLSKQADSLKQMKLCYIQMIYNPDPEAKTEFAKNGRSLIFETRRLKILRPNYIDTLISSFKALQKPTSVIPN